MDMMLGKFHQQIDLSTAYSGLGSPEAVIQWLKEALDRRGLMTGHDAILCTRASDSDEACREVLLSLDGHGPTCVFNNLVDRCPSTFLQCLGGAVVVVLLQWVFSRTGLIVS